MAMAAGDHSSRLATGASVVGFFGGVPARDFTKSPVLLVAGGIGITPVIGVFQAALAQRVPDLNLVWVVRHASMLTLPFVSDTLLSANKAARSRTTEFKNLS